MTALEHLRHMAVLIPAHNEEALLERCLHSVLRAADRLPVSVRCEVIVAVDWSTDRTLTIAEGLLRGRGRTIQLQSACVGEARQLACAAALDGQTEDPASCWLANTDADCAVPSDWLLTQLALADQGFDAVAGIVDVDSFEEHAPHVATRFRATYLLHPDGTHPHVHGANVGVRASCYLAAGGWSGLKTAEDHDLWRRLQGSGARCLSTTALSVLTSGRRLGRAPHGFADALAAHNAMDPPAVSA